MKLISKTAALSKAKMMIIDRLRLGVGFGTFSLGGDFTTDDKLSNVVGLGEIEETSDLGRSLKTAESRGRNRRASALAVPSG